MKRKCDTSHPPVPCRVLSCLSGARSYLALVCLMQADHFNDKEGLIEYNVTCFKETLAEVFRPLPRRRKVKVTGWCFPMLRQVFVVLSVACSCVLPRCCACVRRCRLECLLLTFLRLKYRCVMPFHHVARPRSSVLTSKSFFFRSFFFRPGAPLHQGQQQEGRLSTRKSSSVLDVAYNRRWVLFVLLILLCVAERFLCKAFVPWNRGSQ